MSLSKVQDVARGELGRTEWPPGSNCIEYNTEYYGKEVSGDAYKWCLVFLWWVFRKAGESAAFFAGAKTASCRTLLSWYREQGQTVPVSEVQPGDIVILNFSGTKDTEHCGLVIDVPPVICPATGAPSYIITIEGNTSPGLEGSQDNGGCVALKQRAYRHIVAVCRPEYKEEEQMDDIKGHWAKKDINWCIEHGIMQGYPDGSFSPDKPITRAELAVVAHRICDWSLQIAAEVEALEKKEEL